MSPVQSQWLITAKMLNVSSREVRYLDKYGPTTRCQHAHRILTEFAHRAHLISLAIYLLR